MVTFEFLDKIFEFIARNKMPMEYTMFLTPTQAKEWEKFVNTERISAAVEQKQHEGYSVNTLIYGGMTFNIVIVE